MPTPPPLHGITIRAFRAQDARATYKICEDAFAAIQTRRRTYDEWAGLTIRGFHLRGRSTTTLWTHSKTGALGLYKAIGMTVRRSDTVLSRQVVSRSCEPLCEREDEFAQLGRALDDEGQVERGEQRRQPVEALGVDLDT
jgi:hypothetical protein